MDPLRTSKADSSGESNRYVCSTTGNRRGSRSLPNALETHAKHAERLTKERLPEAPTGVSSASYLRP
jgi:hypothetical protein